MASFGLTAAGFVPKPFTQILADKQAAWLATVDAAADFSATTPEGQILTIEANAESELWQLIAAVFAARDPQSAEGAAADDIGDIRGIPRAGASFTQVQLSLTFSGAAGPFAPGALVVAVAGNPSLTFTNTTTVSSPFAGTQSFLFQATTPGATPSVNPNTVTVIITPQTGWTSVTNPTAQTQLGSNTELDAPYLARQAAEIANRGSNSPSATAAALIALGASKSPPVTVAATIVENRTSAPTTIGSLTLPPNSYAPVIYEPTGTLSSTDYAPVLWANKPDGISMIGNTFTTFSDPILGVQPVAYFVPTGMPLFISATIVVIPGTNFSTIVSAIQTALVSAAVATTPASGIPPTGQLAPGSAVIGSQLSAVMQGVPGVTDVRGLTFGFTASPVNTAPITVLPTQIATILAATVATNVVLTQGSPP